jgi:lipopolysaccharide transport system ATP-binding protein
MSSDWAIRTSGLAKCYTLFDRPSDRLRQMLWRGRRKYFREFWALRNVDLEVGRGEVLGIVGRNGAGKSTFLQLLCGTLTPTAGNVEVNGRIAALLELGAGFNPEFTGRENIYLSASILGLTPAEINTRFDSIVDFSGIREFIEQPVKTYSSGMYMRLAFAIATSIDPDILIIDEALSVGDGAFARKSFDRIMSLKENGATILFCSHSMYHIEAMCGRAMWLEHGSLRMIGHAPEVTAEYNASLACESVESVEVPKPPLPTPTVLGTGRISRVEGTCDGISGQHLSAESQRSTLTVTVTFVLDPALPKPSVALGIENTAGIPISSAISLNDVTAVVRDAQGLGRATIIFPKLPLLKGMYRISAFLACEHGVHIYDTAPQCLTLEVTQTGLLQGVVALPHRWVTAEH